MGERMKEIQVENLLIRISQRWAQSTHKDGEETSRSKPYIRIEVLKRLEDERFDIELT